MFAALMLTLPTQPNAVRLRLWRALKALGCALLRDGVYLLPREQAKLFDPIVDEAREHGGSAAVLDVSARSEAQRAQLVDLFDRREAYAQWRGEADALAGALPALDESESRRRLRIVAESLQSIRRIDYYAGAAADQAADHLAGLRQAIELQFSKGEAAAQPWLGLARLDPRHHRGRLWATRARPWVDRLACVWLIRRFIDPAAQILWLDDPDRAPQAALGFDYDGARFTPMGTRVTFEVMAASFGLDTDPQVQHIAHVVRYLDSGGIPVAEAAGVQAVLTGLREVHADDELLAEAAAAVFDALHASCAPSRAASMAVDKSCAK
jgi:hypothetical protein